MDLGMIGNDGVKMPYWEIPPGAANAAGQDKVLMDEIHDR
jgi:hypothetical protein